MNIIIVGSGVVGSATGKGFARMGHAVRFVDIDPARVAALLAEGYDASDRLDLTGPSAFVFVTLPTPNHGNHYDLSAFTAGVRTIGERLRDATSFHTVIVRSTVPPGTCDGLVRPELEAASGMNAGDGFALASNPEFLRARSALEDFLMPRLTLIASHGQRTIERLQELYRPFGGEVRSFSKPAMAEFIKCAHNIFNATKISFWNEMWRVCQVLDLDADEAADVVARSAEASFNPAYGTRGGAPYGGVCLPKDTRGFLGFAHGVGIAMPMLEAVIRVNEQLGEHDHGLRLVSLDAEPSRAIE